MFIAVAQAAVSPHVIQQKSGPEVCRKADFTISPVEITECGNAEPWHTRNYIPPVSLLGWGKKVF